MNIAIVGNGSFGMFLRELLQPLFGISDSAPTVILAVPISAYGELGERFRERHLLNVCSVQQPSTTMLLKHTSRVTSIHPLFGRRTPAGNRHSILTHRCGDPLEDEFLRRFESVSKIYTTIDSELATPEKHDRLMARTHLAAFKAAADLRKYVEAARDVPDFLVTESFRRLRQFVQTLDDMPQGTVESILANPYD